jgi:imidazolonepropionase-like amidohydrolase
MPAIEALLCAMQVNANILGVGDKIGSIEKGKLADIVAVNENPTSNIKAMEKVSFVMKEGVVYKQE